MTGLAMTPQERGHIIKLLGSGVSKDKIRAESGRSLGSIFRIAREIEAGEPAPQIIPSLTTFCDHVWDDA